MSRTSFYLLVALVAVTAGCTGDVSPGVDIEHAAPVTFAQFRGAVQGEEHFYYVGTDDKFHYFETGEGFYSLPRKFEMPFFERRFGREPGSLRIEARIDGDRIIGTGLGGSGGVGSRPR